MLNTQKHFKIFLIIRKTPRLFIYYKTTTLVNNGTSWCSKDLLNPLKKSIKMKYPQYCIYTLFNHCQSFVCSYFRIVVYLFQGKGVEWEKTLNRVTVRVLVTKINWHKYLSAIQKIWKIFYGFGNSGISNIPKTSH